eukprot:CAMPEP_0174270202 /NCGR_PEP_ID=MMETSP0439-20130205/43677_1 /TAXON_ID=0 /ORGANISM="Stereomyxa ramosa, Strain Chinc5" /LENGTH=157 /DNA_ID=CAMNT_0015359401 /DNA_START=520 /DNA_END=991 /DNA_ORIENTATION=+
MSNSGLSGNNRLQAKQVRWAGETEEHLNPSDLRKVHSEQQARGVPKEKAVVDEGIEDPNVKPTGAKPDVLENPYVPPPVPNDVPELLDVVFWPNDIFPFLKSSGEKAHSSSIFLISSGSLVFWGLASRYDSTNAINVWLRCMAVTVVLHSGQSSDLF